MVEHQPAGELHSGLSFGSFEVPRWEFPYPVTSRAIPFAEWFLQSANCLWALSDKSLMMKQCAGLAEVLRVTQGFQSQRGRKLGLLSGGHWYDYSRGSYLHEGSV